VASASPNESRGAVMAVWVGFARLGQTLGPVLAGVSVAAFGFTTTFGLGLVGALVLALGTAVMGAYLRPARPLGSAS
jgi:MFS family permease